MDSSTIDQADLDRLTDKDKQDLRQFIQNEQQRTRIQAQSHDLTETCFKKCVTGSFKNGQLDKGEQACLTNCVDRFMDVSMLAVKHLQSMRQG
ncbi:mitochondrial import inner membrane translocase subunit tim8 [Diaporthe sp. PMI_573]|nr:mitochondrial import inner membrane translocase subunit tim8 [Diaporthaceae sp. PMI_573]